MTTARRFLSEAKAYLGYKELRPNWTIFGEWYGDNPAPWCAMFLSYCAERSGGKDNEIGKFSSTVEWAEWFAHNGRFGHTPRVGAIVFYDWGKSHRVENIDHAGVVEAVRSDGFIQTIEGNTSDAVMRRVRNPIYVVGYGYPKYDSSSGHFTVPETVRVGSHGPAVRRLQRLLNEVLGLPAAGTHRLIVDGDFYERTLSAVKLFQTTHHITRDGIVGKQTWTKLLAEVKK